MRVSFDTTLDDIHAFNAHYAQTAALPQRTRKPGTATFPEEPVRAGYFDEQWKLQTVGSR